MSNEPVYLWNWYGTRRHVPDPDPGRPIPDDWMGTADRCKWTLCGQIHRTRADSVARLLRWYGGTKAQRYIDRLDTAPLCKTCEKKVATGSAGEGPGAVVGGDGDDEGGEAACGGGDRDEVTVGEVGSCGDEEDGDEGEQNGHGLELTDMFDDLTRTPDQQ